MKLYRFSGRAELFIGCGMIAINHTVSGNLTELKRYATKWRARARAEKRAYHVHIHTIYTAKITQRVLVATLNTECTEGLVDSSTKLKGWEWSYEEPIQPSRKAQMKLTIPKPIKEK